MGLDESQLGHCAIGAKTEMSYRSRSLGRVPQPGQEDLTIMDRLASALERLSSAQPSPARREVFKAPDFTGEGNVEDFVQQFQEVAMANEWSEMATLLHIRTHLKVFEDLKQANTHLNIFSNYQRYHSGQSQAVEKLQNYCYYFR